MTSEVMVTTTSPPDDGTMTTIPSDQPTIEAADAAGRSTVLRRALRANAGFSVVTGLLGLLAGSRVAEVAGIDPVWLVPLGAVGLLGFAGGLLWLAAQDTETLRRHVPGVIAADGGWVLATAAVVGLGWLSSEGRLWAAAIAVVVGAVAIAQWLGLRRLDRR